MPQGPENPEDKIARVQNNVRSLWVCFPEDAENLANRVLTTEIAETVSAVATLAMAHPFVAARRKQLTAFSLVAADNNRQRSDERNQRRRYVQAIRDEHPNWRRHSKVWQASRIAPILRERYGIEVSEDTIRTRYL